MYGEVEIEQRTFHGHSTPSSNELIVLDRVSHAYQMGGIQHPVLHQISLTIKRGQSCAIVGASGSGKSTLLNILGMLDRPTSGTFLFDGVDTSRVLPDDFSDIRNQHIGFVFQNFNLLPRLNALDNVALPLLYGGYSRSEARHISFLLLERVGLSERTTHYPADLSGGQRQRVAIARALVCKPSLILADEPTGNLDSTSAKDILDLLFDLNQQNGVTLLVVTHDDGIAQKLERRLHVHDGRVFEIRPPTFAHA